MNLKVSIASLYGMFVFTYMSVPIMLYFGMSLIIPYILCGIAALLCLFFSNKALHISFSDFSMVLGIIGVALIDKSNDVIWSYNLESIFAFLFAVVMVYVTAKSRYYPETIWKYMTSASWVSLIILIASRPDLIFGEGDIKIGSGVASYLYVIFVYIWIKSRTSFKYVALSVLFLAAHLFQSRSAQLAIVLFVVSNYFLGGSKHTRGWLWVYFLLLCLTFAFVIYYEMFVIGGISNEFTGRGLIWQALIYDMRDSIMFGVANVPNESRIPEFGVDSDAIAKAVASADPHNGVLYVLYNSGVVGLSLFCWVLNAAFKRAAVSEVNASVIIGAILIFAFEGASLYGVSLSGIVLLLSIFVPLKRSYPIEYKDSVRDN